jgi:hypothetical protein
MSTIDYAAGPTRVDLTDQTADEIDRRIAAQVLFVDARRSRASYFDGRFLAARDLTREQTYAMVRQADLSIARSGGIIRGLEVSRIGDSITISAGAGVSGTGELASLASDLTVPIAQIPEDDRVDLSLGVARITPTPAGQRTGVYLLGVRPVEYAATPAIKYPTTPRGSAGVADGDLIEATAVTLRPFRIAGDTDDPTQLRSELARAIFLAQSSAVPPDLVALALVYLSGGRLVWIDPFLVRREVAADDDAELGLSASSRALREAQFLQHGAQLGELVTELAANGGLPFPASRYFRCLPAVGQLPASAIDASDFTQVYFPPQMTVQLSVVVDVELPALIEDALHQPTIDLVGGDDDFDFTYVNVLIPMPATAIGQLRLAPVTLPPVLTPPVLLRRLPVDALREVVAARQPPPPPPAPGDDLLPEPAPLLAAWRQALASVSDQMLWYVRVPPLAAAPVALFDPQTKQSKEKEKEKDKDKDNKETKDKEKEGKETKEKEKEKDSKEGKEKEKEKEKDTKEGKEGKEKEKDTKEGKEGKEKEKDTKEGKEGKEKEKEKEGKEGKEKEKDTKEGKEKDAKEGKEKDAKEIAREKAKDTREKVKEVARETVLPRDQVDKNARDSGTPPVERPIPPDVATPSTTTPATPAVPVTPTPAGKDERTFIEPEERPDVGSKVTTKTKDT